MKKITQRESFLPLTVVVAAIIIASISMYAKSTKAPEAPLLAEGQASTSTASSAASQVPSAAVDPARAYLKVMAQELGLTGAIVSSAKEANTGLFAKRVLQGYSISPTSPVTGKFHEANGLVQDSANSGDATFHSSQGYKSASLICIDSIRMIAPNNDFSKCGGTPEVCTPKTETFCASIK